MDRKWQKTDNFKMAEDSRDRAKLIQQYVIHCVRSVQSELCLKLQG